MLGFTQFPKSTERHWRSQRLGGTFAFPDPSKFAIRSKTLNPYNAHKSSPSP